MNGLDAAQTRAWIDQLAAWSDEHRLHGYDPFDVKQHPLIRAAQPYKWPRRLTSLLCDMFPLALRRLLRVKKTQNAKAFALTALGNLRLHRMLGHPAYLDRALTHLQWLRENAASGYGGLCWGYPFDISAKGLHTPAGTPIGVVSSIAGEAFAAAFEITSDPQHLEAVRSIAQFFLEDIPRLENDDGTLCFGYTPTDRRRVHNANLHAAAHLYRTYSLCGEERFLDNAAPALQFTLKRQRPDGSWPYGEWQPGEPFDKDLMDIVDHHHTGFVLRSLYEIRQIAGPETVQPGLHGALERGYAFYRDHLFESNGMPITAHAKYPVDIHACAEAILCPSILSPLFPGALDLAHNSLNWTARHMRDPKTGLPYYRKYPFFTARLTCPRWGVAWIFYALCEHLTARQTCEKD